MDPATSRRGVRLLGAAFALFWMLTSLFAGLGPAAYVALSGDLADAGVYFALYAVAAAVSVLLAGRLMDRVGRRPVLAGAHILGGVGYAVAGSGAYTGSLVLFTAGVLCLSAGAGGASLTRLAAAELFPPAERGRGVAGVQFAALGGALAGPAVLVVGGLAGFALVPTGPIWFLGPFVGAAAALLVLRAPETLQRAGPGAPADGRLRMPDVVAGFAALAFAQGAMVAVMGVAGVHVSHMGSGAVALGLVMMLHFAGMFGPSPVVGRLADKVGRRPTIVIGLAVIAAGGLTSAFLGGATGIGLGLLLIGGGWALAYIAGTVLLADAVPAGRRARLLGLSDFTTSLLSTGITASGGVWYAARGIEGLGLMAAALVVLPALAVLGTWRAPVPEPS